MKEVYELLKKAGVYYLATMDGDRPRTRPFGTIDLFEDKLYIQTGKVKSVSAQIKANPHVELCAMAGGKWLRVAAEAVLEHCFTALNAQRVWCGHYEGNEKSRRVIEKCGFVPVLSRREDVKLLNEERLCHYYALTAQQWHAHREEHL